MFNDDLHGLNPHLNTQQIPGGVAPSRHALSKQRYIENKRARLDAETTERQVVAAERVVVTAVAWLDWMLNVKRDLVRVARIRWGAKGV
jgi:hypothetical protein